MGLCIVSTMQYYISSAADEQLIFKGVYPMSVSSASVVSVSSTLVAINAGKSRKITLATGEFTFVNHSTGQEEGQCQGGLVLTDSVATYQLCSS